MKTKFSTESFLRFILLFTFATFALAQEPAQPAPPQSHPLSSLERYRNSRISIYMNDFGELSRYRDANAALPPPAAGDNRVQLPCVTSMYLGDKWEYLFHAGGLRLRAYGRESIAPGDHWLQLPPQDVWIF